jgi:hypothetical protein
MFLQGKTIVDCYAMENSNLREVILGQKTKIVELESRLYASSLAAGEAEPLSAEPENTTARKKEAKLAEAAKKGISKPVAGWAAAMYGEK